MVELADFARVTRENIQRAGPRYTPGVEAGAPNLQLPPLLNAIDALSWSASFATRTAKLEGGLRQIWKEAPDDIRNLFSPNVARSVLFANTLASLRNAAPSDVGPFARAIRSGVRACNEALQPYRRKVYDARSAARSDEEQRSSAAQMHSLNRFDEGYDPFREFVQSPDFDSITNNVMLLLGGWGAGKTHLLCDIAKRRLAAGVPTLFVLAQGLPTKHSPVQSICDRFSLSATPDQLLATLDSLGAQQGQRALLVFDGINEGDRAWWRKHLPGLVAQVRKLKNVALVLSCRSPFDEQMVSASLRARMVQLWHSGFENVEFDAQREFFAFFEIPIPHVPLLAPEFSKPLFLKILCKTISSLSRPTKTKRVKDFAAGHKGMTKLLEDFVLHVGKSIEADFALKDRTCWRLLKGVEEDDGSFRGLAPFMASNARDFVTRAECLALISELIEPLDDPSSEALLRRLIDDGLLSEDFSYFNDDWVEVIRLPYQRFSDHLIARHLLAQHLNTRSEGTVRRSFYRDRPLGQIFEPSLAMNFHRRPGLASAVMLEFPERVKRVLPEGQRELMFVLPQRSRTTRLVPAFVEGLLWRDSASFDEQTFRLISLILQGSTPTAHDTLDALVCLASRTGHPCSAERLRQYLAPMSLTERDLFWSEFLRGTERMSSVQRVLDWIVATSDQTVDCDTDTNLLTLCAMFLTCTVRRLRDKATRCLVVLGERHPEALFRITDEAFAFNDPYVVERLLAASYGVLMRRWAFPGDDLRRAATKLAPSLSKRLIGSASVAPIEHILSRDYAQGIVELSCRLAPSTKRHLRKGLPSKKSIIPSAHRISRAAVAEADSAIQMDFDNYTTGRLVDGRSNYDSSHQEYQGVQRQIRWRVLNLGYETEKFRAIDRSISSSSYGLGRSDGGSKVDRYGKKYSWIAFFEVAGRRRLLGMSPHGKDRISDCDIDPSFPDEPIQWGPPTGIDFTTSPTNVVDWVRSGSSPDYSALLQRERIDSDDGPWVLIDGYVSEKATADKREVFTFLRSLFVGRDELDSLRKLYLNAEYPGNRAIPEVGEDHYLFAGEIGWSSRFGSWARRADGRAKAHTAEAFDRYETRTVRRRFGRLKAMERMRYLSQAGLLRAPVPSEMVELDEYHNVRGVTVELPASRFSWESYHSQENQSGNPEYPAPRLVEFLGLRKRRSAVDLVDRSGKRASCYREFGDYDGPMKAHLLYLRRDLADRYLDRFNLALVWLNWGERSIHDSVAEGSRDDPALQEAWSAHAHIHKCFHEYKRL